MNKNNFARRPSLTYKVKLINYSFHFKLLCSFIVLAESALGYKLLTARARVGRMLRKLLPPRLGGITVKCSGSEPLL